jgi:NADH:ubiquinone oxidoreductase subunit 5 (subunit L)/multisubunit Na+/H+ antiporter MnhA subunit
MNNAFWLITAVAVPIFGPLLIPVFSKLTKKSSKWIALALGAVTFFAVINLLSPSLNGNIPFLGIRFPLGFNLVLKADPLAVFMALVSSSLSFVIIYYSMSYISHYKHKAEYFATVVLFLGAMMGLVFSMNLFWMFIFWEITAFCSWRLVGFFRTPNDVLKADKTFIVTAFGALCMLLGIVIVYAQFGHVELELLKGASIPTLAMVLILIGIFSKSATLPFSTWLPDAGVAPAPVTALLHAAVLVKIGVYAYARIFCATLAPDFSWGVFVAVVAGLSAVISAGAALIETNIKRVIAYSTISQIGFIFLGFAVDTRIGIAGAVLYILMHGVAKGGLFLCAGIIEHKTGTKDITKMGGLFKAMPITAVSFAFCAFSIMGLPPFGGFFAKYMVFNAAVAFGKPSVLIIYLLGAILTILYLMRLFYAIFLGESKTPVENGKEADFSMVSSVAFLGFVSLLLGVLITYPAQFANQICRYLGVF